MIYTFESCTKVINDGAHVVEMEENCEQMEGFKILEDTLVWHQKPNEHFQMSSFREARPELLPGIKKVCQVQIAHLVCR
jgi:hypothetical protein